MESYLVFGNNNIFRSKQIKSGRELLKIKIIKLFYSQIFKKIFGDIQAFSGATDIPILDL